MTALTINFMRICSLSMCVLFPEWVSVGFDGLMETWFCVLIFALLSLCRKMMTMILPVEKKRYSMDSNYLI